MGKTFEVGFAGTFPVTPEQAWEAITVNTGGWLWPIVYEPGVGSAESGLSEEGGFVSAWEPPSHFGTHAEGPDGWFNTLDYRLTLVDAGTHLAYTHRGVMNDETYDIEYDACVQHTAFYYHTLGQYLAHFVGKAATYLSIEGPAASTAAGSSERVCRALGVAPDANVGDAVAADIPGIGRITGELDYRTREFTGIRTADALIRVFGRDVWGWPVGISIHHFDTDVDVAAQTEAWTAWLASI